MCPPFQDAWGLGHVLWALLSPDADAAPFPGGDPASYTDASYTPPHDAAVAGPGAPAAAAAAGRIVAGLLRVDAGARWILTEAVAALEALLFVVLAVDGVLDAGGGGDAAAAGVLQATMLAAAGATSVGQRLSVRAALAADFVTSDRSAPASLAATLARLYA
jgi:hypothetical protein